MVDTIQTRLFQSLFIGVRGGLARVMRTDSMSTELQSLHIFQEMQERQRPPIFHELATIFAGS